MTLEFRQIPFSYEGLGAFMIALGMALRDSDEIAEELDRSIEYTIEATRLTSEQADCTRVLCRILLQQVP